MSGGSSYISSDDSFVSTSGVGVAQHLLHDPHGGGVGQPRYLSSSTLGAIICPITSSIFVDPVILHSSGHTYERWVPSPCPLLCDCLCLLRYPKPTDLLPPLRHAIQRWLKEKNSDPVTNLPMASGSVILSPLSHVQQLALLLTSVLLCVCDAKSGMSPNHTLRKLISELRDACILSDDGSLQ